MDVTFTSCTLSFFNWSSASYFAMQSFCTVVVGFSPAESGPDFSQTGQSVTLAFVFGSQAAQELTFARRWRLMPWKFEFTESRIGNNPLHCSCLHRCCVNALLLHWITTFTCHHCPHLYCFNAAFIFAVFLLFPSAQFFLHLFLAHTKWTWNLEGGIFAQTARMNSSIRANLNALKWTL